MNYPAWILAKTSHPGNIGSAARAIKTMGFSSLILANPKGIEPHLADDAMALASGADDVLKTATITPTLKEACANFQWVFGMTSRDREFGPPAVNLKEACQLVAQAQQDGQKTAFVFGTSLNLAQAVMVCAYETRQALIHFNQTHSLSNTPERASQEAINAAMDHWRQGLETIGFLDPNHPKKLMPRLRALFDRAGLQKEEVDLIRGIAKQMLIKK